MADLTNLVCFHSTLAQGEQIKELRRLIEKKAEIEQEMATVTEELQAAYTRSLSILKVALDGRIDDYDEALRQLDEISNAPRGIQMEVSQEL